MCEREFASTPWSFGNSEISVVLKDGCEMVLDYRLPHDVWFDPNELGTASHWIQAQSLQAPSERQSEQAGREQQQIALALERFFVEGS